MFIDSRHWKINMRMALVWNPSYAVMATFKISSKISRLVLTQPKLRAFKFVFGAQSCVCLGLAYVSLQESLHVAFDTARVYSQTLEHFRLFYKENESVDLDAVQRHDHGDVLYIHVKIIFVTHFSLTTKRVE